MPPRLYHLLRPLRPLRRLYVRPPAAFSGALRLPVLSYRLRQYSSAAPLDTTPQPLPPLLLTDSDLHPVPGRKDLQLRIEQPVSVTPNTPTIISLPLFTPAPSAPSTAIVITPTYSGKEPPVFPTVLHDIIAAVSETRQLFPDSRTGLLASRFAGGIALAVAITHGPKEVTAVAVSEPVVDICTEATAEGLSGWDPSTSKWHMGSGYDPELRRKIYGSDPRIYWTDPFAAPLLFFASLGVEFPDMMQNREDYDDWDLVRFEAERRKIKRWPPSGYVPGHGWGLVLGNRETVPRILLSLGEEGRPAEDRALFVERVNCEAVAGKPAGIIKEGLEEGTMGRWLEAVLRENEVEDVMESDPAGTVLWKRFGGEVPLLEEQEPEEAAISRGGRGKGLAALSVEALLMRAKESVVNKKRQKGVMPVRQRLATTWSRATSTLSAGTAKPRAAKEKGDTPSVEELLAMDYSLWSRTGHARKKAAGKTKETTSEMRETPATGTATSESPSATKSAAATATTTSASPDPEAVLPTERPENAASAPKQPSAPRTVFAKYPRSRSLKAASPNPWSMLDKSKPKPVVVAAKVAGKPKW